MVLLFNPRAVGQGSPNYRIPNSILQIAASIHGCHDYHIVDGNRERDSWSQIKQSLESGSIKYFGVTVMPGPQLKEAIPISKQVKALFPEIIIIWGGYFASNQSEVILSSGYVDFCINGPGDHAFPTLIQCLEQKESFHQIHNLIYKDEKRQIIKTPKENLPDQDKLPDLPYRTLDKFYSIEGYLKRTHLGERTAAYHSSLGCPFKCSFCAVVPIYEARWRGKSAEKIYRDLKFLKEEYGADAVEFHDNNFFVSEQRTVDFCDLIKPEKMHWWGEGRIDTIDRYSDTSLENMRESGCKMIFFGAESGNDDLLANMDKGGRQSGQQILKFARRISRFEIIPEYSFVLGLPANDASEVKRNVQKEIDFIYRVKEANPKTEIIIYVYSPVPTKESALYKQISNAGFKFPQNLDDWLTPAWENFDLRKNPLTPWLTPSIVNLIQDFETVIHSYYPTSTDLRLTRHQRKIMRFVSSWRFRSRVFALPYELKLLQKFWLKYRQPEWEGF